MFRDLITLLAFAIFFVVVYFLVLENKERTERDGQGFPVIGVFLAWLSPILDEIYEAVIGRRLRGQKDKKTSNKILKRTGSAQKETDNEEDHHEDVPKVPTAPPTIGSHSKRRDSVMTAQSADNATDHSKQKKQRKKKRRSSKHSKSTLGETSEDGGTSVDESRDKKKKKKKRRSSKKTKTQNTSVDEGGKSVEESAKKQKKPSVSPRNSKQKRQSKLQSAEPSSDDGGGYSSENSTAKKRKIRKEAPTSSRYSKMLQKKMGKEPSSDEDDKTKPPPKNSVDQKTDDPLVPVSLPRRAFRKLRDSFKKVKKHSTSKHQ